MERLFDIAGPFLAIALAGERFLRAPPFSGLQIERVPLDFLDDIFLLHFAFEAPQRAFERFAILQMNFCQIKPSPPSDCACRSRRAEARTFILA